MVGDAHHQIHIVLDQDHGHAHGRELAQQRTDRRGILRVQPCRRLIEREHARPDRERAGDFDQPFVDMRERIRRPIERTFVADKGEQAFSDLGIVAVLAAGEKMRRKPAAPQRDHDIVDHRHRFEQLACLISTRNAGARNLIGAQRRNDAIAEPHRSRIRPVEAADHIERRALAGPVRADDACDRTRLRLEVEIAHGAHAAETHRKIAHRKRLAACAGGEKAADVASLFCKRVALLPGQNARDQPDQARRREPQHGQHQHADEQEPVLAERREQFRQQHHDQGADDRTEHAIGAAQHHDQEEQDRLKERKGFRADEIADRSIDAAGQAGRDRRNAERRGANERRIEFDRDAGGFGIAHRAHGVAPNASAEPCERGCRRAQRAPASDRRCRARQCPCRTRSDQECRTGRSSRR